MNRNDLLSVTTLLSVLLALHISQDIVFGLDRAGLNHLVGVASLLVIVCGALLFIWTLYVLGVNDAFSIILAVLALRARLRSPQRIRNPG